jgi:hypothetical protein
VRRIVDAALAAITSQYLKRRNRKVEMCILGDTGVKNAFKIE